MEASSEMTLVGREGVEPPQLSRRFYNRWATLNLDLTENG